MSSKSPKSGKKRPKVATLTGPKLAALSALMTSPTLKAAAQTAGVPDRTLREWLRNDESFKAAVQEQQAEARAAITRNLVAVNHAALAVTLQLMRSADTPPAVRQRCVEFVFNETRALIEQSDIMAKLTEIEERLKPHEH